MGNNPLGILPWVKLATNQWWRSPGCQHFTELRLAQRVQYKALQDISVPREGHYRFVFNTKTPDMNQWLTGGPLKRPDYTSINFSFAVVAAKICFNVGERSIYISRFRENTLRPKPI